VVPLFRPYSISNFKRCVQIERKAVTCFVTGVTCTSSTLIFSSLGRSCNSVMTCHKNHHMALTSAVSLSSAQPDVPTLGGAEAVA